jgi:hypothetical protein
MRHSLVDLVTRAGARRAFYERARTPQVTYLRAVTIQL